MRYYEWLNRHEQPELLRAVERAAEDMSPAEAAAFIRAHRPRGEEESWQAALFWEEHRPLLLLALLGRSGPVVQVERELGLGAGMLYHFLKDWGVVFMVLPARATLEGPSGRFYEGVVEWDGSTYRARVRGQVVPARWVGRFRLLDEPDLLPARYALEAARLAYPWRAWTRTPLMLELRLLARELGLPARDEAVSERVLRHVFGDHAVELALARLNPCGCALYDPLEGCLLERGREAEGPCEDRIALETSWPVPPSRKPHGQEERP